MRCAVGVAAVALLCSISSGLAQNKEAVDRISRHKDLVGLMAVIQDWGLDRNVQLQLDELRPRIASDLEYAGAGGVLIIARFEKTQTEAGSYRRLVGDRVEYVGIGVTDYDAAISGMARAKLDSVPSGSKFDPEGSTAYWFYYSKGEFAVSEKPFSWLRRGVLNELVNRKRRSFNWRVERSAELTRLARAVSGRIDDARLSSKIEALLQSRNVALSNQLKINAALQKQLDRARRAAQQMDALKAIGFLVDYASFVSQFEESPVKSNASPMSREQAQARLDEIKSEANAKATQLANDLKDADDKTIEFDMRLEINLRDLKVPTDNVPPMQAPLVNPNPG